MPKEVFEVEDPMELVGIILPGEPGTLEAMATALVEEYVLLGWDEPRLMTLFVNPLFLATHRIYRQKGEAYVRVLIRSVCARFRIPARPDETNLFAPAASGNGVWASIPLIDEPVAAPGATFVIPD